MSDMSKMVVGIVMIAVCLIVFPIVLTAANEILQWTGTGSATISDFTGLETLVAISATLIYIGLLVGGGWLTFTGVKGYRRSKKGGGKSGLR